MIYLDNEQTKDRIEYIQTYLEKQNPATLSEVDANANVTVRTISTLDSEIFKPYTIQLNRQLIFDKIKDRFGRTTASKYLGDVNTHLIYIHDETSLKPYCTSITLYPFLLQGTKAIGGVSTAPTNLQSFCGSFVNLVYQIASDFAGAVATVEFLHIFDYFARKQYGKDYLKTNEKEIKQELQGVVYALNQPASARGNQSVFWNISVFDKPYFKQLFEHFVYPDNTNPCYESVEKLQKFFMEWFRLERKKELLTFPVLTANLLTTEKGFADKEFKNFCARQMSKGHSFFVYMSDSVDSLASCCRLRNEFTDNTFSYSLGAGGVVTGSAQVITMNLNHFVQARAIKGKSTYTFNKLKERLTHQIRDMHKYLYAHKLLYKDYIDAGLIPSYTAGFINLDKQFLTIGINGLIEALEYMGYEIKNTDETKDIIHDILQIFKEENKQAYKIYGTRFNTELVPAENLGVKNAKWDRERNYEVPRDCYNSYFYKVEDNTMSILDKFQMYGERTTAALDGGSALHLNIDQLLDEKQMNTLYELARINKVPYWTFNCLCTICNECNHIDFNTLKECSKCHSKNVDYGTRIIGYLKRITNFSKERQKEHASRYYTKQQVKI